MARDWKNTDAVRQDILTRMASFGENIAEFPLAMTMELRNGKPWWVVDIHIRVRRTIEFDLTGEGEELHVAMRRAYLGLNSEGHLRQVHAAPVA